MTVERRFTCSPGGVKVVKRADGGSVLTGYAAVFYDANDLGTEYELYDAVVERIMPGAFDRAIREDDVRALFNHDACELLGRTKSGTLRLSVDARGLRYEIDAPDTESGRDVTTLIQRGDITGSSFGFIPDATTYRQIDGLTIVERDTVHLYDVSPVTFPAYESTSAGMRSSSDAVRREIDAFRISEMKRGNPRVSANARARAMEVLARR